MSAVAKQKHSNVIKAPARPKRSIDNPNPHKGHPLGLWIDYDLLRKHMSAASPKYLIPKGSAMAANNRYLELADLALSNIETISSRGSSIDVRQKKRRGL